MGYKADEEDEGRMAAVQKLSLGWQGPTAAGWESVGAGWEQTGAEG